MAATFFGFQTALDLADDVRRSRLADVVRAHRMAEDLVAQRRCWTQAGELLAPLAEQVVFGAWDLLPENAEAVYEEWASGVEAMASWSPDDFGTAGNLLLVTGIVLVASGSNAARTLDDLCDLPKSAWHRRATYAKLFQAVPLLNLTNVLGSGLYLAPRPDQPGFSRAVLTGEGFTYLTPVMA